MQFEEENMLLEQKKLVQKAEGSVQPKIDLKPGKDLQVEVLRIVAMLMIVACHMVIHLNVSERRFNMELLPKPGFKSAIRFLIVQYGQVGVSLFFIISGYFLCKKVFNYRRIFAAWAQMFLYCIIILASIFIANCFGILPENLSNLLRGKDLFYTVLWNVTPFTYRSYWFMSSYLIMLMFMPFINILINNMNKRNHAMLLVLLACISLIPLYFGRNYTWNDIIYAIFGYLVGAFISVYRNELKEYKTNLLLASVVLLTLIMLVFNYFASSGSKFARILTWDQQVHGGIGILPIAIATCIFIVIHRIDMTKIQGFSRKIILKVSKATFGVYLIHEHMFIFIAMWTFVAWILPAVSSSVAIAIIYVITLLCVYAVISAVAIILDLLVKPLSNKIALKLEKVANCVFFVHKNEHSIQME